MQSSKPTGRTILVGDVHGCRQELEALLDKIHFSSGDRLVFVGDVIARGPDSLGVLDVVRTTGAILVRGNHEQRLLDWKDGKGREPVAPEPIASPKPRRRLAPKRANAKRRFLEEPRTSSVIPLPPPLGRLHRELAEALRPVDWSLLQNTPIRVDLESHGLTVVHAGILPGIPLDEQRPETMMRIRTVRVDAVNVLWGACFRGPPHVVFGHNAAPGLQLHPWATGLDTGCVYGGKLTALVLAAGQKIPRRIDARRALLVSEPARRVWWQPDSVGADDRPRS